MPLRERSSIRRSQSPSQLSRRWTRLRWTRLRTTRLISEVNPRCRTLHSGGVCYALLPHGTFAYLCRSPPQRAAPGWTSPKGNEAHRNSPRMPGSMPRNRSLLIAMGMLSLLQVLPMPLENSRLDIPMPHVSDIRASLMTPTAYRPIRCSLELRPGRGASNARLVSHGVHVRRRDGLQPRHRRVEHRQHDDHVLRVHPKKPGLPSAGPGAPRPMKL
jgi:hypothetical protein